MNEWMNEWMNELMNEWMNKTSFVHIIIQFEIKRVN